MHGAATIICKQMENLTQNLHNEPIEKGIINKLEELCTGFPEAMVKQIIRSFLRDCNIRLYNKNEVLGKEELNPYTHLYFVQSGTAHTYSIDPASGRKEISDLWVKNDIIYDLNTDLHRENAFSETTSMLERGHIISISHDQFCKLFVDCTLMNSFLLGLKAEQLAKCRFYTQLLKLSTPQKVSKFLHEHPTLIYRINKEEIAIYLRISRSRLSKALALNNQQKGKQL